MAFNSSIDIGVVVHGFGIANEALGVLQRSIEELGSSFDTLSKDSLFGQKELKKVNAQLKLGAIDANTHARKVKELSDDYGDFSRNLAINKRNMLGVAQTLSTVVGKAFFDASKSFVNAGITLEQLTNSLRAVKTESEDVAESLQKLVDISKLPGIDFQQAVSGVNQLRATKLNADLARDAVVQVGNALASVGASPAELSGVIRAFSQIQSKGKVYAEEIYQIAERLPQIRTIMLEQFGTADTELLAQEGISSERFINQIVKGLGRLPRVEENATNAIQNLQNAFFRFRASIGDTLLKDITGLINGLTNIIEWFNNLSEGSRKLVGQITLLSGAFAIFSGIGFSIAKMLTAIPPSLTMVTTGMNGMATASVIAGNSISFLGKAMMFLKTIGFGLIIGGVLTGLTALAVHLSKTSKKTKEATDAIGKYTSSLQNVRKTHDNFKKANTLLLSLNQESMLLKTIKGQYDELSGSAEGMGKSSRLGALKSRENASDRRVESIIQSLVGTLPQLFGKGTQDDTKGKSVYRKETVVPTPDHSSVPRSGKDRTFFKEISLEWDRENEEYSVYISRLKEIQQGIIEDDQNMLKEGLSKASTERADAIDAFNTQRSLRETKAKKIVLGKSSKEQGVVSGIFGHFKKSEKDFRDRILNSILASELATKEVIKNLSVTTTPAGSTAQEYEMTHYLVKDFESLKSIRYELQKQLDKSQEDLAETNDGKHRKESARIQSMISEVDEIIKDTNKQFLNAQERLDEAQTTFMDLYSQMEVPLTESRNGFLHLSLELKNASESMKTFQINARGKLMRNLFGQNLDRDVTFSLQELQGKLFTFIEGSEEISSAGLKDFFTKQGVEMKKILSSSLAKSGVDISRMKYEDVEKAVDTFMGTVNSTIEARSNIISTLSDVLTDVPNYGRGIVMQFWKDGKFNVNAEVIGKLRGWVKSVSEVTGENAKQVMEELPEILNTTTEDLKLNIDAKPTDTQLNAITNFLNVIQETIGMEDNILAFGNQFNELVLSAIEKGWSDTISIMKLQRSNLSIMFNSMNEGMAKSMLGTTKDIFDSIIDPIDESMKALDATNFSDLGGKIFDTGEINAEGKKLIGNLEKARLLIREQNQSLRDQYDLYVQQNDIKNKQLDDQKELLKYEYEGSRTKEELKDLKESMEFEVKRQELINQQTNQTKELLRLKNQIGSENIKNINQEELITELVTNSNQKGLGGENKITEENIKEILNSINKGTVDLNEENQALYGWVRKQADAMKIIQKMRFTELNDLNSIVKKELEVLVFTRLIAKAQNDISIAQNKKNKDLDAEITRLSRIADQMKVIESIQGRRQSDQYATQLDSLGKQVDLQKKLNQQTNERLSNLKKITEEGIGSEITKIQTKINDPSNTLTPNEKKSWEDYLVTLKEIQNQLGKDGKSDVLAQAIKDMEKNAHDGGIALGNLLISIMNLNRQAKLDALDKEFEKIDKRRENISMLVEDLTNLQEFLQIGGTITGFNIDNLFPEIDISSHFGSLEDLSNYNFQIAMANAQYRTDLESHNDKVAELNQLMVEAKDKKGASLLFIEKDILDKQKEIRDQEIQMERDHNNKLRQIYMEEHKRSFTDYEAELEFQKEMMNIEHQIANNRAKGSQRGMSESEKLRSKLQDEYNLKRKMRDIEIKIMESRKASIGITKGMTLANKNLNSEQKSLLREEAIMAKKYDLDVSSIMGQVMEHNAKVLEKPQNQLGGAVTGFFGEMENIRFSHLSRIEKIEADHQKNMRGLVNSEGEILQEKREQHEKVMAKYSDDLKKANSDYFQEQLKAKSKLDKELSKKSKSKGTLIGLEDEDEVKDAKNKLDGDLGSIINQPVSLAQVKAGGKSIFDEEKEGLLDALMRKSAEANKTAKRSAFANFFFGKTEMSDQETEWRNQLENQKNLSNLLGPYSDLGDSNLQNKIKDIFPELKLGGLNNSQGQMALQMRLSGKDADSVNQFFSQKRDDVKENTVKDLHAVGVIGRKEAVDKSIIGTEDWLAKLHHMWENYIKGLEKTKNIEGANDQPQENGAVDDNKKELSRNNGNGNNGGGGTFRLCYK